MYNSGRRGKRASDGYGIISQADKFYQTEYSIPVVTSFAVTDGSYVPLDDTAVDTAGGQTIVLYGSGFAPGATVTVGGVTIGAVTYLDQGRLTFTAPAKSSGSYTVVVINSNGGAGILVPGLVYSGVPTWSTSAGSVGTVYETTSVNSTFVATGDAPMTYSVLSGSLPPGTTLSTTGVLSGSAPIESGSTTYSFTIRATDGQLQDTDRSFSLTVSTDLVTFSSPTNNQVISSYEYAPISNVTASATSAAGYGVVYSSNTRPTGITVNATTGVISGTANTVGNTYTRLTATANTTSRTATRDIVFNVNQDVVTWSSPNDATSYSLQGGSAISPVTLSATSAAGFGVQYSANALPSGLSISGSTISGTPDTAQTVNTLLTATANTTGRSATRTISWSISLGDLNWKNVSLLLNANTPTPTFISDSSLNNSQLTIVGDTKPNNFNPYSNGYYSNYFDGSGDYLTIADNTNLEIGDVDFTIESWFNISSLPASGNFADIVTKGAAGVYQPYYLFINSSGSLLYYSSSTGSSWNIASAVSFGTITPGIWYHVAVSRQGTNTRLFLNGTLINTIENSNGALYNNNTAFTVCGRSDGTETAFVGYISNVRLVVGTAVYTSAFTPSGTPLTAISGTQVLTCQSNRLIDNSVNNFTITKNGDVTVSPAHPFTTPTTSSYNTQYSTYFPGASTSYLETVDASAFNFGTGDFTAEAWAISLDNNIAECIFNIRSSTYGLLLRIDNPNTGWQLFYSGTSSKVVAQSTYGASTSWTHHAITRQSGVLNWWINGVLAFTNNANTEDKAYTTITIGKYSSYAWLGHISNVRVVKGLAVYTGTFTPPTSPLQATQSAGTNISAITAGQTTFLSCQSNIIKDNSSYALTVNSYANAQPIALSPFTMTTSNTTVTSLGSAYFDGTGDYLTIPPALLSTTGSFTVETWVYPTATTDGTLFTILGNSSSYAGLRVGLISSTAYVLHSQTGSSWAVNSGNKGSVPLNTWSHIAVTRNVNAGTLWVNGVSVYTFTFGTLYSNTTNLIGAYLNTSYNGFFTGYMSDARVVNGTALYTSNFLPPQAPLTPVENTQLLTCQYNGGATNNGFVDQSSFNNIITRNGNATQGTFSPYSQTGWSYYYPALAYNTYPSNPISSFGVGATFTVEGWVNMSVYPTTNYFFTLLSSCDQSTALYWAVGIGSTGLASVYWYDGNSKTAAGSTTLSKGVWYHVAVVVTSGVVKIYVNGVQETLSGTTTLTNPTGNSSYTTGTERGTNNGGSVGYISNLRTSTTAVYSANFTPSTTPLSPLISSTVNATLLTAQSNRFVDNSRNNYTLTVSGSPSTQAYSPFGGVTSVPTSYSTYNDGSASWYYYPLNWASIGTGDYTLEGWIFPTALATYKVPFASAEAVLAPYLMAGGEVRVFGVGGYATATTASGTIVVNQWQHLAIVRNNGTFKIYVNGVLKLSTTTSGWVSTDMSVYTTGENAQLGICRSTSWASAWFSGYVSNVRMSKVARYTTASTTVGDVIFTAPTSPFTSDANTLVLAAQSNIIIDNGPNKYSAVVDGTTLRQNPFNPFGLTNTTQVSYSPSVNGGSMYFDGSGDYLTTPSITLSSDFTIEFWLYGTDLSGLSELITNSNYGGTNGLEIYYSSSTRIYVAMSTTVVYSAASLVPPNTWNHIAVVRSGTTLKLYVNGVSTPTTATGSLSTSLIGSLYIATDNAGTGGRAKYMTDVKVTQAALYTSNFYPPVSPLTPTTTIGTNTYSSSLLLNGTSGGIIDYHGTNNLETVGNTQLASEDPYAGSYYSNYFTNGTGIISTAANSALSLGTSAFTIEAWVYNDSGWGTDPIIECRGSAGNSTGYAFGVNSSGYLFVYNNGAFAGTGNIALSTNKWYHVALVREGTGANQTKFYVDGQPSGSFTLSGNLTDPTSYPTTIGDSTTNGENWGGFISNLRMIKDVAVYTGAFTVPTSPLSTSQISATNINAVSSSQTVLLTCQSNKFVDNSVNTFTLTATNVVVKSMNPFQQNTGKSLYFDGTGDYVTIPNNQSMGSGSFTIECWAYIPASASSWRQLFSTRASAATASTSAGSLALNTSGYLSWFTNGTISTSSTTFPVGAWTHVALVRNGTALAIYQNGVSVATATNSDNLSVTSMSVGGHYDGGEPFTGYIKDLRVTKGVARYTATFTPPTTTFEVK